uniref:MULE transposase domain-containing protein n=1 Tax=Lactuca sativa TaxID=4236 RepID=A0A9R1X0G0_LACSA|nr:hypothetical protein LSAT_V11C800413480 [Lactuca sativa]
MGESSNSTNESYCNNIIKESEYKPDGGKDKPKPCDTLATYSVKRKPNSNKIITGCTVKIIFENVYGITNYKVKQFFELYNHLMESIEDRPYMKKARKMSYSEKEFVVHASKAKIGPIMAHKIRAILKGGYEYVGAKFLRDGDQLAAMFWADEREKAFYADVWRSYIFYSTFRTNKYKMVFVPFTLVDHHKKSVTVGTIASYEWLLKAFLRAHERKAPKIVLIDQDPAMKQAVKFVLPNSRHGLCMWHIMKKLQTKV